MMYFLIFIVTIAILSYFQQKKAPPTKNLKFDLDTPSPTDDYIEILMRRPDYSLFVDGDYTYCYTDQYSTDEGYLLRELLLLIWWGKVKKGRNIDANIPKYFYERYHINPNNLTKRFFDDGFIFVDDNSLVKFTDKGVVVKNKYLSLWEIHSVKNYYPNLDIDFPNWNINQFLIKKHTQKIAYLKALSRWNKEMLDFFRCSHQKDDEQLRYHQDQVIWCLNQITLLEAEIDALME